MFRNTLCKLVKELVRRINMNVAKRNISLRLMTSCVTSNGDPVSETFLALIPETPASRNYQANGGEAATGSTVA